jgi:L-iditol 2-dehydrogenase
MNRAAVIPGPDQPIEVREVPVPPLEPGSALLETEYSEICGTDAHLSRGRLAGVPYPIVPGHVSVGRVAEIRGRLESVDGRAIAVGDRVTFYDVHETCHACWFCLVGKTPNRCRARRVYGITYSAAEGPLGGWSEAIYLKPGVHVLPLPDEVSAERFIAGGCALPTALHAIDRAEIKIGDHVVVQGAGPVGLCAALLSLLSGAGSVIVVERHEVRAAAAERLGVDHVIRIRDEEPGMHVERVLALTGGRGADLVIEATGVPAAVKEGIQMSRDGGRYVVVGHYTDTGEVLVNPHTDINRKHLDVRGVWGSGFEHFYRMIGVLARSRVPGGGWEQMITRTYGLDEMNTAVADVEAGRIVKGVVRPRPLRV